MSNGVDFSRNPCPDRILEDAGVSFAMGALGGSAYHFIKGLYNSPNGFRLVGGATAARMNAARVGGSFAVWGSLYSAFDCALVHARQKEDPWNSIAAGAATGGLLSLRRGLLATGRSALFGGAILTLIEGANIAYQRFAAAMPPPLPEDVDLPQAPGLKDPPGQQAPADDMPQAPSSGVPGELPVPHEPSGPTGWFAGLFGRKQQQQQDKVPAKSEVLELELPSTAVPTFNYE